jgi:hypothetical protein
VANPPLRREADRRAVIACGRLARMQGMPVRIYRTSFTRVIAARANGNAVARAGRDICFAVRDAVRSRRRVVSAQGIAPIAVLAIDAVLCRRCLGHHVPRVFSARREGADTPPRIVS